MRVHVTPLKVIFDLLSLYYQSINQSFICETNMNRQDSDARQPVSQDSKAEKPALIGTH